MQLLVLIMGGLFLGQWLENQFGAPSIVVIVLPIVGMILGLMIIYKNNVYPPDTDTTDKTDETPDAPKKKPDTKP